jgi:hypothetical protein
LVVLGFELKALHCIGALSLETYLYPGSYFFLFIYSHVHT